MSHIVPPLLCALLFPVGLHAHGTDSLHERRMQEVEVQARAARALETSPEGRLYWRMESLADMPHVLGNADPLRALQLLPGVATNNDYASGIHIQGCTPAQSLLEMDGAPVFNAAHLLGLFSVFTTSHFRGMALVKNRHDASFANRTGGRLSFYPIDSVAHAAHLDATVSFMESEGTLTLPAGRHSALYLSARGSYLNLLYGGLLEFDGMAMRYGLQDYNLTFVSQPGTRDKLRMSLYHGRDHTRLLQQDFQDQNRADWQNTAAALHHEHHGPSSTFSQKATFSHYRSNVDMETGGMDFSLASAIQQAGYAPEWEWTTDDVQWQAGADYHYYRVKPMTFHVTGTAARNASPTLTEQAHEASAYVQSRIPLGQKWQADAGIRLSYFHSRPGKGFFLPAPRLTLRFDPAPAHSLSLHYGLYAQYLHQIPVSNGGLPVDYWTVSSGDTQPGQAHSLALSYRYAHPSGTWEFEAEAYYKHLTRQHEYYGSILNMLSGAYSVAQNLVHGKGRNYGLNLMLKKNRGRLTGWIGYALSRSERRFPEINATEWFNSSYDRRHDLSVVANYRFNGHWSLGGNFVYASGTPYTRTNALYVINNNLVGQYGKYNGAHLPPTHRMDVALTYRFAPRGRTMHSLNFSVYNLYARRNVLFRYLGFEGKQFGYKSVYSLCRMLPSIGYTLKF